MGQHWSRLFKVLAKVGKEVYRMELFTQRTIHPVVYVVLLKLYDALRDLCYQPPPESI